MLNIYYYIMVFKTIIVFIWNNKYLKNPFFRMFKNKHSYYKTIIKYSGHNKNSMVKM